MVFLNVRDFGAKGDGQTDDLPPIQSAINALPEEGGTVFIPKGVYHLSSPIRIDRSYVRLEGDSCLSFVVTEEQGPLTKTPGGWSSPWLEIVSGGRNFITGISFNPSRLPERAA